MDLDNTRSKKRPTMIIIILAIVMLVACLCFGKSEMTIVRIDGDSFLVRNLSNKDAAADMLSRIKANLVTVNDFLVENKSKYSQYADYIDVVNSKIKNIVISESSPSCDTSYTINNGEEIVLCLRSKETQQLYNINDLMFVALDAIAHVACPEYGHTKLFKELFMLYLQTAVLLGIYRYENEHVSEIEYCGMQIQETSIL